MHIVSFPGLGIDGFKLSDTAFSIPFGESPFEIKWYGVIIGMGMMLAVLYIFLRARQFKLFGDDLCDLVLFTIPCGVIGARLYYVFADSGTGSLASKIFANKSLNILQKILELFNIRGGGLAIYGGIIVGALTIFLVCRYKKINILKFLDCVAPGVMLAQAIGRWGNFFNGEAYGCQTDLPWRMGLLPNVDSAITMNYYHPTFLYECLWNLLGFTLINLFYKKKKFDGQWFLAYVAWYGTGRAFIELLRTDSLWIFNHTIRVSTLVGTLSALAAIGVGILLYIRSKGTKPSDCIYYENSKRYLQLFGNEAAEVKENGEENSEENIEENTNVNNTEE